MNHWSIGVDIQQTTPLQRMKERIAQEQSKELKASSSAHNLEILLLAKIILSRGPTDQVFH